MTDGGEMERRKTPDRRKIHTFFSDERRTGPFDRRNADARHRERVEEMKKIKEIRDYKEKDASHVIPVAIPPSRRKQLVAVGLVLLLLAIAFFFI